MYLKQLYGMRPDIPVFAALRELWDVKFSDQPILALLCASARDVSSAARRTPYSARRRELAGRSSGPFCRDRRGLSRPLQAVHAAQPRPEHRFVMDAGGPARSEPRTSDDATPSVDVPAVVYALYLGHLEGLAGLALFTSRWARMLDRNEVDLRPMAEAAGGAAGSSIGAAAA